jgi:small subunit ribosomal protein S1
VDGLVHISELGAGKRVNHPSEVLVEGQEVEATVLGVDPEKKRISLSLSAQEGSAEAPAEIRTPADYTRPKQSFGTLGDLLKESMAKQKK